MQETERQRVLNNWLTAHKGLLIKVVRAYAPAAHDQEDLLQEITYQLWESIPKFEGRAAVTTWIYRVALYAAMSWSKKERRRDAKERSIEGLEHVLAPGPSHEDPRLDWLYEQITRLDPIDRSLTLLLLDGLSYRQIADTLGISESNVGVKIHRIKKLLASRSDEEIRNGV